MKTDNKVSPPKKGRGPLRVDYVPIGTVKPSDKNSRKHDPHQIDKIVASIEAVGWTKRIAGKQATHGSEKKTFEAVAKARGKA